MMMYAISRTIQLPLLIILAFAFTACGGTQDDKAPVKESNAAVTTKVPSYATTVIKVEDVARPVNVTGRVVPLQQSVISSQVPGKVLPTRKLLQEGKYYHKGEVIIRLDDEALRFRLRADRAKLVSALVAILSDLSIDYPAEHPTWLAYVRSIDPAMILPELPETENEQLGFFLSTRNIPAQYYGIKAQEATLDDYVVTAPISGKLTQANVEPGTIVQPGQQLAVISRTDLYEVRAAVPAASASQLTIGQKITMRATNINQTYEATLNRFGTRLDQQTQTVTAFLRLSGPELREGLYLEGELPGKQLENVAVLPKTALTRDGSVHFIDQRGLVRLQGVETVLVEADRVFVRGLPAGAVVITESVNRPIVGTTAIRADS